MEISQIIPHVESLIFAADRPLPVLEITDLLNNAMAFLEDRATLDQVETALEAVREKYSSEFYAFEVRESGGGYQFLTKKDYYQTVAQLNGEKFLKRLSTAALETLAIIAYKQPISKGEIEHIRGVSTDYSIQKLLEKELIVISGRSENLPGKPLLYTTSKAFMDYFGLNSPKDLPKLKEVFDEDVAPTLMLDLEGNGHSEEELLTDEPLNMIVSETGELVEQTDLIEETLSPVIAGVVTDETLEKLAEEGEILEATDDVVLEATVDNEGDVIDELVVEEEEITTVEIPEAATDNTEVDPEEEDEEEDDDEDEDDDDDSDDDDEDDEDEDGDNDDDSEDEDEDDDDSDDDEEEDDEESDEDDDNDETKK